MTISPLATWLSSWPITASISLWVMLLSRPFDTATKAFFLLAPVAKAFMSFDGKIATSGALMPTIFDCLATVSNSHCSGLFLGSLITSAPVMRLTIHLEMSSEINDPPKPITPEKITSASMFKSELFSANMLSTPSSLKVMLSTNIMAILVIRNKKIRFIVNPIVSSE